MEIDAIFVLRVEFWRQNLNMQGKIQIIQHNLEIVLR